MASQSYESIRKQIEKLEARARKLEDAAQQKKQQAVAQVLALMKKLGVAVDDLGAARPGRTRKAKGATKKRGAAKGAARKPVAAKYRHPKTGEAWSGRGRTPRWLAALEAQGASRDEFRV